MPSLRDKYGGKLSQAINRAIRAEMVGGDDLLDSMERVDRLTQRLRERGLAGVDEAQAALDALRRLKELMAELVQRKYQVASQEQGGAGG